MPSVWAARRATNPFSVDQAVRSATSITEWKAPTDFLLETPGSELLRTVPQIGNWQGYSMGAGRRRKPAGKKSS